MQYYVTRRLPDMATPHFRRVWQDILGYPIVTLFPFLGSASQEILDRCSVDQIDLAAIIRCRSNSGRIL